MLAREEVDRELPLAITLAVALPKGDRQRWLVEKATELGVAELCPLETEYSGPQSVGASLERLRRGVIEAAKQCGRNRLMTIEPAGEVERTCGDRIDRWSAAGWRIPAAPR